MTSQPEDDLTSDETFGAWLNSLTIDDVLPDLINRVSPDEKVLLNYFTKQRVQSNPPPQVAPISPIPGAARREEEQQ